MPQFAESLSRSRQVPTPLAVQRVWPAGQLEGWHAPAEQVWPPGQTTPPLPAQPPQLPGSVWILRQAPLQAVSDEGQEVTHWPTPFTGVHA